ncbi:porin family protein [Hymenobacter koreensis]|uniref:Porin family protein n=1 Tax=Hymenobacter koreensis TaxID=1084523 RepID=A0ABP8IWW3_9BACT
MKKTLLAVAVLCAAFTASSSAQAQGIQLGVKVGANYSNLAGDLADEDRYQSKIGPHAGLMLNVSLLDDGFLSLQPELLFSQKGFKYADNEFTLGADKYKYTGKVNYNYIDVPVLFKINADGLYFELGPQVGYLLSVSNDVKLTKNGQVVTNSSNYDNLDNAQRTELGYAAGFGYQSESGPMIGIRYNGGLSKYGKDGAPNDDFNNARNSTFMLSVGYMFGGK